MCTGLSFLDAQLIVNGAGILIAGMGAAVLLGAHRNALLARVGLVIVVAGSLTVVRNGPSSSTDDLISVPAMFAIGWLVGWALRERTERTEAAEDRAVRAEREREVAARLAVAEERARIARELHDVVAHAVSVIVLQVGAVRHRLPETASADREALRNVEEAGRTALTEMRRLLNAMRDEGDTAELTPHPGLGDLDRLLHDVGAAGMTVDLRVLGDPSPLPAGLDLSAYRIVQEGLTNSLKHSGAGRAEVTVAYEHDELRLEVRDHGSRDGNGSGGPGPRAGRDRRAREDLRRRDVGRAGSRRRVPRARPAAPERGTGMTIRVLVVDDQSMVRAGFRLLLADEPDIEVVAEASNGREAVAHAARLHPDVILMDIRMPELDGLEATRRILATDTTARVLVLTTFDLDDYVFEALRAGASGFVLKDDPPEQLLAAVRTVAAGEALLSPAVTRRVIRHFAHARHQSPPPGVAELTSRELEVFELITRGLSNAEIGAELFISDTTVKTHVTRLLQKLGLRDRAQAIVLAYQTGLFDQS